MFKNKIILLLLLLSCGAYGQSNSLNLNLPVGPQSYQSDKIRAGDLDCSNAIGSATNLEFGVVGFISNSGYDISTNMMQDQNEVNDIGVYARITIPIGAPKERINCNILYQLELEKKRLEVQKLKQEVLRLQALQFEN